jgi:hypothetical protein
MSGELISELQFVEGLVRMSMTCLIGNTYHRQESEDIDIVQHDEKNG